MMGNERQEEIVIGKATKNKTQRTKQANLGRGCLEYTEGEGMTRNI
jgi:hypothetical protein